MDADKTTEPSTPPAETSTPPVADPQTEEHPITGYSNAELVAGIRKNILASLRYEDLPDGCVERRLIAALMVFLAEVEAVSPGDYEDAVMSVGLFAVSLRNRLSDGDAQHA